MLGSPAPTTGPSIDNTATLIRYAWLGDANIDGKVNALDFNVLASNFGAGGGGGANKRWFQGDFNYDGTVNTADFNALAINFNIFPLTSPPLGTVVPQPAWPAGAFVLLAPRRRPPE